MVFVESKHLCKVLFILYINILILKLRRGGRFKDNNINASSYALPSVSLALQSQHKDESAKCLCEKLHIKDFRMICPE